jgi:phosphatidylglycerol:prolipoprotein diacylglycerol transferase
VRDLSIEPNKVSQVSFLAYVDAIVPAILIGQIIGRYGNYQNQELYGAVISSGSYTNTIQNLFPLMNINGIVHQPLFFYESCLN